MKPLVELTGLGKAYGSVRALDGAGLSVRAGEIVTLLGPNGAGKSTLMSIAAGLLRADAGTVAVAPGVRIGLMPQEPALYPMLSAAENLAFIARAVGLRREAIEPEIARVLEAVQIVDRRDDRVSGLSGGMKRRLGFAAAILGGPQVLLLDEPTAGVDPQSRLGLLELVRRQAAAGSGVVYSTHYIEEAERIADRVAILHQGRIRATGTVRALLGEQGETRLEVDVQGVGADGFARAVGDGLGAVSGAQAVRVEADSVRLLMTVLDRTEAVQLIVEEARRTRVQIRDLRFHEPDLESAFIALTGREVES
jgi:linearmycin/streptolysin S transport system ATP-binding protein